MRLTVGLEQGSRYGEPDSRDLWANDAGRGVEDGSAGSCSERGTIKYKSVFPAHQGSCPDPAGGEPEAGRARPEPIRGYPAAVAWVPADRWSRVQTDRWSPGPGRLVEQGSGVGRAGSVGGQAEGEAGVDSTEPEGVREDDSQGGGVPLAPDVVQVACLVRVLEVERGWDPLSL